MADFPTQPTWLRGLRSKIKASTTVLTGGGLLTDDQGYGYIGDGATQLKSLSSLARNFERRRHPMTGVFYADAYGADPTGQIDSGPAINAAIADCIAAGGSAVVLGSGTYLILTTINMTGIYSNVGNYSTSTTVALRGAGSRKTKLTGGENGYGFIELVGSNYVSIEGMSIVPTAGSGKSYQYAILSGRKAGNASSGNHVYRDVMIYGTFTAAGVFAMSSEQSQWDDVLVYVTAGSAAWLAREANGVTAKYVPLSQDAFIGGGNGLNSMRRCVLISSSAQATGNLLILEYVQGFTADQLYTYSQGMAAQIRMAKQCMGATFIGIQQEYGGTSPIGFYFSASGATPSSPDFRGLTIRGGRALPIYAEDGTRLAECEFSAEWRGGESRWQIDVDKLYDSRVHYDTRLTSNSTKVTSNVDIYRVRTDSRGNQWGPEDCANLVTPALALGATSGSGGTFAAGTYFWVVTATNSYGETVASNEVTATVAANGSQVLTWPTAQGATGYKVFRASTTGGPYQRVAVLGNVLTYTDTGGALTAVAPPTLPTAGRPNAAYRGVGARIYDTTLNRYLTSDGATWQGVVDVATVDTPTVGELVPRREFITSNLLALTSGTLLLDYFTASKSETITSLTVWSGNTPAGATPTLCRLGVFAIDGAGNGTLVAATASDTGMYAAANTAYTRALTAAWNKVAGQRYAVGVLTVSGFTTPSYWGQVYPANSPASDLLSLAPAVCGRLLSQSDLPASFTAASVVGVQSRVAVKMNP